MEDTEYWNNISATYDRLYASKWSKFEDERTRNALAREIEKSNGKFVLDIGCGGGLGFKMLSDIDEEIKYIGSDVSDGMLDLLLRNHPEVSWIKASGDTIGDLFDHNSFDFVLSINVSASFPQDMNRMLLGIRNILKPGGRFYLSFLNKHSLRRLLSMKRGETELYRTRGDTSSSTSVIANVVGADALRSACQWAGLREASIAHQSVLGGVWESPASIWLERLLSKVVPQLGHAVIVTGGK